MQKQLLEERLSSLPMWGAEKRKWSVHWDGEIPEDDLLGKEVESIMKESPVDGLAERKWADLTDEERYNLSKEWASQPDSISRRASEAHFEHLKKIGRLPVWTEAGEPTGGPTEEQLEYRKRLEMLMEMNLEELKKMELTAEDVYFLVMLNSPQIAVMRKRAGLDMLNPATSFVESMKNS